MVTALLLRADEAAQQLALSRSKVLAMVAAGDIPSVRIGRAVRIPAEGLRHWVETRARQVTEEDFNEGGHAN